jgi:hypothetical protein
MLIKLFDSGQARGATENKREFAFLIALIVSESNPSSIGNELQHFCAMRYPAHSRCQIERRSPFNRKQTKRSSIHEAFR